VVSPTLPRPSKADLGRRTQTLAKPLRPQDIAECVGVACELCAHPENGDPVGYRETAMEFSTVDAPGVSRASDTAMLRSRPELKSPLIEAYSWSLY
jgi:hypothetical protein